MSIIIEIMQNISQEYSCALFFQMKNAIINKKQKGEKMIKIDTQNYFADGITELAD